MSKGQLVQLEDFDRTLGTDELNLAEFPLASLASRPEPGQNTLVFEDDIFDKGAGQTVHRSLIITGSTHYGLPTAIDNDVLLVLIHLSNVRSGLRDKRIEFSRYELVKFLGWDLGGKSYRRLDDSLQRWTSVTLQYKHAWWDSSGRRWRSRTFHVLESLELRGRDEIGDDGLSAFVWNEVIFDSFQAGNLKRIDLNVYFQLESAIARQIYRFCGKRFHRAHHLDFDLKTFACEHIGLSRSYDVFDLKRKLQPALEELEQIGFIARMPVTERYAKRAPGKWQIRLRHQTGEMRVTTTEPLLVSELTRRGVNPATATELAGSFSSSHIGHKLALHDRLLRAKDRRISKNPAGFLAAAIRHDYQDNSPPRQSPKIANTKRQPVRLPQKFADDATASATAVCEYLAQLPASAVAAIESAALASSPPIMVQSYERLKASGGDLFEQVRIAILTAHLERQGIVSPAKRVVRSGKAHRQQVTDKAYCREPEPVESSIVDAPCK